MFKKTIAISLMILFLNGMGLAFQERVEWPTLSSPEGRFSAVMPEKPQTNVRDVDTTVGKLALYTFGASNNIGQYMISYADYPNEASGDTQREAVLDGVRGGVLKGLAAELVSETRITLNGYPGRELRARKMSDGSELVFTWRTFLVGRRLFQLGVATSKVDAESPDIQKFLTSFELSK
jgi:hypothetical protein